MTNFSLPQYLLSKSNDRDVIKSLRRVASLQKRCTKQSLLRQKSKSMVIYTVHKIVFEQIFVTRMFLYFMCNFISLFCKSKISYYNMIKYVSNIRKI